jgi:RecB family exonuclease
LPLPPYFSFTQLAAYDTCPLQYKYAHVIRVPSLGKGSQSFGKTMHAALEWFLQALMERERVTQTTLFGAPDPSAKPGLAVSKDELLAKYDEVWLDDWYESKAAKEEHRAKGREMLSRYYDQCVETPPMPKLLEQEFSLKFGAYVVKGAIDRIDEAGGGVEIIDYKTGKPKTEDDLEFKDKRQLFLYQLAATRLLGLVPEKLTYAYLQDGTKASFLGSEKQLAKLETEVEATLSRITSGDFTPTPGKHCGFCDFKDICDFREA